MMRSDLITAPSGPQPVRLRFSVDQYYQMYELGLIEDFEKSEIIDGELIRKMSIGDRHAWVVDLLTRFFILNLSNMVMVRGQNPLRLGDFDEPEPDIVLADLSKYDGRRHPRPGETLLVIEVSESSLRMDRTVKLPLYAAAEIPEVWIINLPNNIIEVHKHPSFGIYQMTKIYQSGEDIHSEVLGDITLAVNDVLS